jgi:mRNA interferase MazF
MILKAKTGEIVWVDLNPVQGGEKGKTRPCLILVGSGHPWEIVIVVPITEPEGSFRPAKLFVPIPADDKTGLKKDSVVDCFQVRCLSENRVSGRIGTAPADVLEDVRTRLAVILNIGEEHIT